MKMIRFSASAISLIVANLIPLYGALFLGWNAFSIMILYWLESAIIGFFNIQKMYRAEGSEVAGFGGAKVTVNGRPIEELQHEALSGRNFFIPFFSLHYGIFMFVHLIFLVVFFGVVPTANGAQHVFDFGGIFLGFISLLASHAMSYKMNFIGKGEYKVVSASQLFLSPYPRIIVMHMTVILGGFFVMNSDQPVGGLALMIVLKTIVDLASHLFEHSQIAKRLV